MKPRKSKLSIPLFTGDIGSFAIPDTGWRCAVCFSFAQVIMIDVTLCVNHAKRYNFGYGDSLKSMREEYDKFTKRK